MALRVKETIGYREIHFVVVVAVAEEFVVASVTLAVGHPGTQLRYRWSPKNRNNLDSDQGSRRSFGIRPVPIPVDPGSQKPDDYRGESYRPWWVTCARRKDRRGTDGASSGFRGTGLPDRDRGGRVHWDWGSSRAR